MGTKIEIGRSILNRAKTAVAGKIRTLQNHHSPQDEADVKRLLFSGTVTEEDIQRYKDTRLGDAFRAVGSDFFPSSFSISSIVAQTNMFAEKERLNSLTPEQLKKEVKKAAAEKARRWGILT